MLKEDFSLNFEVELAIMSYFFDTDEGLEILIEIEAILLKLTDFSFIKAESFDEIVQYYWRYAFFLAIDFKIDPVEIFSNEIFWQMLIESECLQLIEGDES